MKSPQELNSVENDRVKTCLLNQFHDVWNLLSYHLQTLTTAECLWRPGKIGPHVFQDECNHWRGKLPEREGYDIGPPSIGWISWHIVFWWSMVLNHSFGDQSLRVEQIVWPGDVELLRTRLNELKEKWQAAIQQLDASELAATNKSRWPVQDKPFSGIVGWVNMELMKNTAELGYIRFLYTQTGPESVNQNEIVVPHPS